MREPGSDDEKPTMTTVGDLLTMMDVGFSIQGTQEHAAGVAMALRHIRAEEWVDAGGLARKLAAEKALGLLREYEQSIDSVRGDAREAMESAQSEGRPHGSLLAILDRAVTELVATRHAIGLLEDSGPEDLAPAASLMAFVGASRRPCKQCARTVWIVRHDGAADAFDGGGGKHSVTCAGKGS